ncbi:MAG: DUF4232 domain-containing protein [Frankiales bacterium]|nr:DUF4232 domain-containing protein [Frankiales bacterium]
MSPDLQQLFDDAGRTPPRTHWAADDVVRRGDTRRRRRRALTATASVAATALVVTGAALLLSPGTDEGGLPAASSLPPAASSTATVGSPEPTTTSATSTPTPTRTACRASEVSLALGAGGAAAGTSYRSVVATVKDGGSCTLAGYPAVTVADAAGQVVGSPALHDPVAPSKSAVVGPGLASFLLGLADTANYDPAACAPVPVTTLRVALAGDPTVITLALPAGTLTCSHDVSALGAPITAGPWVAGPPARQ